ncbi:MFS transporter [uncultured Sphingomonas sp.]|uniref:MFS transporter n=1 Tax=uncultured Sphingomonas sp. TaxID=158754 RepID=UPI0035CBF97A
MTPDRTPQEGRAKRGPLISRRWLVVLAAAVGISVSSVNTYSLGVFVRPLEAEFGWSRSNIMLGLTISAIAGTLFGPLVGLMVDRVGPRRIGILGVFAYCVTTALLGLATSSIFSWWGLWVLVASTAALIKPMVWTAPISALFDKDRGLAMSLALAGTGLASGFAPLLAETLIDSIGWREAYAVIGLGWGLVALLLLVPFFHGDDHGRRATRTSISTSASLSGLTAGQGFRTSWFLKLFLTTLLATMLIISMMVNIVPMMRDGGLSSGTAARIAGIAGLASIIGRICTGLLLDRVHGPWIGGGVLLLPAIACATLLAAGVQVWSSIAAVILLGLAIGGELDIVAYLASRYFGRRSYGTLFGAISSMLSAGTAIGPPLAAYVFDRSGSYAIWWWLMIPTSVTASLLVASLGRYPDYEQSPCP